MAPELQNLKESNEFLNLLLDNINSAVLIADENLQIHQFNNSFLNLFDTAVESVLEAGFGETTGCVNAVLENKPCGETSQCANCILRRSLVSNLIDDAPVNKQSLNRVFYINGEPLTKHLQFSSRSIMFQGQKMFLVIIYDVTDIEQQKIELQKKQRLIDRDLESAAAIQKSLLPDKSPSIENIQVAWTFEPCEQIGGDIFNIHHMDERNIGLYMLDVCGHGVPAALISVAVSQFLNSADGLLGSNCELLSPEIVLNKLDRSFPFERFDSFFSIIYMTIDVADGWLDYSCAGHPSPIIMRSDGTMDILDQRGPIIGFGTEIPFGQSSIRLQAGDRVILYTDGLLESRNTAGDYFGRTGLYQILKNHRLEPVQDMVDAVCAEIKNFRQQTAPDDDISLLAVEYGGIY
ncbi:Serine phosphatase RsbU, regulator of sigma subunit [Olavius algarvensis Delta 1 endosymbiont]|nr:Serine phosphatase RsbU, regulator of sigma subunit [Olavius algarvensis Delta 1 endosymbiont]